jgi:FdrA protein
MATGQGSPADSVPQWLPLQSTQEGNIVVAPLESGMPGASARPEAGEQGSALSSLRLSALFSGGTLCDEAMHIWIERLGPIYSNILLDPAWKLSQGRRAQGHVAIDFGDDEYTRGRPHPMIDPSLRLKRFQEDAEDPQVGVILLDMVLGYCSRPDPASVYAPAILKAREQAIRDGRLLTCVISLCGTEDDPQHLSVQSARFREAGAEVFTSNADAALRCIEALS